MTISDKIAAVSQQAPPPETRGNFYCYLADGDKFCLTAGPFANYGAADKTLWPSHAAAEKLDAWAHFYARGIVDMKAGYTKPGKLNFELGLCTDDPCPPSETPTPFIHQEAAG